MTWKATYFADTPATPNTVTLASINANDYLVAIMIDDAVADNPVWPTGFSTIKQLTNNTNSMDLFVGSKKAAGGETNIDFATDSSFDRVVVAVLVFSNINTTTQLDVAATFGNTDSNQASPFTQSVSITPTTNGSDIVALVGWDVFPGVDPGNTVTTTFSTTSGTTGAWTNRHEFNPPGVSNNGDSFYRGAVGTAVQTTAGAITVQASGSASPSCNSSRAMILLALRNIAATFNPGWATGATKTIGGVF